MHGLTCGAKTGLRRSAPAAKPHSAGSAARMPPQGPPKGLAHSATASAGFQPACRMRSARLPCCCCSVPAHGSMPVRRIEHALIRGLAEQEKGYLGPPLLAEGRRSHAGAPAARTGPQAGGLSLQRHPAQLPISTHSDCAGVQRRLLQESWRSTCRHAGRLSQAQECMHAEADGARLLPVQLQQGDIAGGQPRRRLQVHCNGAVERSGLFHARQLDVIPPRRRLHDKGLPAYARTRRRGHTHRAWTSAQGSTSLR
jgi:hypothetical protein